MMSAREDLGEWTCCSRAGAGGLATATVASRLGLNVILAKGVRRRRHRGASGGARWVPNSRAAAAAASRTRAKSEDLYSRPRRHCFNEQIVETYLSTPAGADFYERETDLHFELQAQFPTTTGG